jgi:integrase
VYRDWCEYQGFTFDFQRFPTERELPYIPLEKEIDQLIGAFKNSKYGALLQLLKETGFRPIEAMNLRVRDFDLERQIATLNSPAKGSNPRQVKLSNKSTSMLLMLIQGKNLDDKVWETRHKSVRVTLARIRRNTAKKLGNLNLNKITLKTFRHWKATMEYHRTKDILYVKELLGHKNIQNTLVYTHLVNWENDDWVCKVALNLEEVVNLIEAGFEYVTDFEDKKIFRKRK